MDENRRIEFLTEKDIEYFQKMAEKGEAVVLTISEEDLLSLDFTKPVPDLEDLEINTQGDLDLWVKKYKEEYQKLYGDNQEIMEESQKIQNKIKVSERENTEGSNSDRSRKSGSYSDGKKGTVPASNLAERLAQMQLDPEKMEIVNRAFRAGLSDQTILLLLQEDYTTDEMGKMCDLFIQNKERF